MAALVSHLRPVVPSIRHAKQVGTNKPDWGRNEWAVDDVSEKVVLLRIQPGFYI